MAWLVGVCAGGEGAEWTIMGRSWPHPILTPTRLLTHTHTQLFRLSSQRLQIDASAVDIHAYFTTLCDLVQVGWLHTQHTDTPYVGGVYTHMHNFKGEKRRSIMDVSTPSTMPPATYIQVITDKSQRRLVRDLDASLPKHVLLDKIRFSQLIMNLTSNAAKVMMIFGGLDGLDGLDGYVCV